MSKPKGVGRLITSWNESDIMEDKVDNIMDNLDDEYLAGIFDKDVTREEVYQSTLVEDLSEDWLMMLEELEEELGRETYFHARVKGFGWRNLDGEKYFEAIKAEDYLRQLLPDCDCTFYIYKYGKGLAINNFHHDSPMGEWYFITPIQYNKYERNS